MDNIENENYFSIYMKKQENKMRKSSSGKTNKTLKISNLSNLYLPKDQSFKNIIFCSSGKKKCSMSFIRNKVSENNNNKEITSLNNEIDNDKKIDMLEEKIFKILELIDNFMNKYINKNEKNQPKKNLETKKKIHKKKNFYRTTNSEKNLLTLFMTNNNNNNNLFIENGKKNQIRNITQKHFHQKSNSQFLKSEIKNKDKVNKRRTDYGNLINQNFLRKSKKQLSQSQVFVNKNIIYYSPESKKFNTKINLDIVSDNSSTREISEKIFKGNKNIKNNNPCKSNINIIHGLKISNLNKHYHYKNTKNKCMSERTSKKFTNITKKYKLEFDN